MSERYVSFESRLPPDHCANEKGNYSIVGHDKAEVPFLPGPSGERDREKIDAKNGQPNLEPRGLVDVALCDLGVEIGLRESRDSAGDGDCCEKDERKLQGPEIVNHPPSCRALAALGNHLLVSGHGCDSRAHGRFRDRAYIPQEAYFFGDVFQPLAAIILQARL